MEPEDVTFELLREITHDFSEERKLGEGTFGVVYKVRFYWRA
jgi:predicted Ser/Thr protein kinase